MKTKSGWALTTGAGIISGIIFLAVPGNLRAQDNDVISAAGGDAAPPSTVVDGTKNTDKDKVDAIKDVKGFMIRVPIDEKGVEDTSKAEAKVYTGKEEVKKEGLSLVWRLAKDISKQSVVSEEEIKKAKDDGKVSQTCGWGYWGCGGCHHGGCWGGGYYGGYCGPSYIGYSPYYYNYGAYYHFAPPIYYNAYWGGGCGFAGCGYRYYYYPYSYCG